MLAVPALAEAILPPPNNDCAGRDDGAIADDDTDIRDRHILRGQILRETCRHSQTDQPAQNYMATGLSLTTSHFDQFDNILLSHSTFSRLQARRD